MRKLGLKVVKERKMRVMSTRDDVQLESLMFNLTRKNQWTHWSIVVVCFVFIGCLCYDVCL